MAKIIDRFIVFSISKGIDHGRWKVYAHDGKAAKQHQTCPDFAATLAHVKKFKEQPSTDVLRILAPANATSEELRELKENGATLV